MYMKPYYYYIEDIGISYPETTNDLAENLVNKLTNKEILTPFDYLELEKPH